MEKQISIIIPTYNMEKYIGKCLDSLLIPEFDQVEVLVVNDGSKDRSSEIAHSYADRYPGSIRVIDKANGNYGSCINAALPLCTGRYVKILDADDTFDTEAFSGFIKSLEKIDSDVVITEFIVHDEDGNIRNHGTYNRIGLKYGKKEDIKAAVSRFGNSWIQMHQIAYSRDVFNRFVYRQTEGISYTDIEWAIKPLYHASHASFLDITLYKYLSGREGQTMSPERLRNSVPQLIAVMNSLTCFYRDCIYDNELKLMFVRSLSQNYQNICYLAVNSWNDRTALLFRGYDLLLKENIPVIYREMSNLYYKHGVYRFVEDLRRKNYPEAFRVTLFHRMVIFIKELYTKYFSLL